MKRKFLFVCIVFLVFFLNSIHECQAYSNPTDYFRSKNSGNWNDASSWQSSPDNSIWSDATLSPSINATAIIISAGHVIDIITSVILDKTVVDGTCRLLNDGLSTSIKGVITLNDGGASDELTIRAGGIFQCIVTTSSANPYSTFIYGASGNVNVLSGGKIMIGDGTSSHVATGYSGFASESSAKVNWNNGSVFEWNTTALNFTPGIIYFPGNAANETAIFRVSKVSTATIPGSGSGGDLIFNGLLEVLTDFTLAGGGIKEFRDGIIGNSSLTIYTGSGTVTFTGATPILGGPGLHIIAEKTLNLSSGITIPVGSNVKISGTNNIAKGASGIFLVNGILDITDRTISNTSGSVQINGTLKTSNDQGPYNPGNIANGLIALNVGSTIEYNSTSTVTLQKITGTQTLNQTYYNIKFSGAGTKNILNLIDVHTLGSVSISGANVTVDASTKNLGSITTNTTQFLMDGGRLILGTTGTQPNMGGIYNITGGTLEFINNSPTTQTIRSPKTYQNIEIKGTNVNNSSGHILLNTNGVFTIKTNGIFTINDNSIKAVDATTGQKVTVENGGIFRTGNSGGFNGLIGTGNIHSAIHNNIDPANIILSSGSTVEYTRNGDQPITNANNLVYSHLVLSGLGNKNAPPNDLIVQGNFTKATGTNFLHNNGTVIFNGNALQNIQSAVPQLIFNNLANNNLVGLNVNDSISVYRELSLGANSRTNVNQPIALKSDGSNTANVAQIPITGSINYNASGLFIIERYIPNHSKSWQLLSAPAKGKTIKESWQEGAASPNGDPKPGYGTSITQNNSTWQSNGFDAYSAGGPSMKYFDAANNKYIGINSTNDPIANQNAYFLFVRGDRSVTAYNEPAKATVLRSLGKLYAPGSEAPASINVPANSFACIGNPYASSINFEDLTVSEISNTYTIWDPQLTTSGISVYGYGAFRTISGDVSVPSSGNYLDNNIPPIQSGQAFFVQTTTQPGTLLFEEKSKSSGSKSIFKIAKKLTAPDAQIRTNLYVQTGDSLVLIDGTLSQFHTEYSMLLDEWDAKKIANPSENIGIHFQSKLLAIERRQLPSATDTLFYQLTQMQKRNYTLELIPAKWENTKLDAYLEDLYLKNQIPLKIDSPTKYGFSINSDLSSQDSKRFHLLFKTLGGPLSVLLTKWNAYAKNNDILLEWQLENEINVVEYVIESSTDNIHFKIVAKLKPQNAGEYNWLDVQPQPGNHFYRLEIIERNGQTTFSKIVKVAIENKIPTLQIVPNPIINNIINLQFKNQPGGKFIISVFNTSGQLIFSDILIHVAGNVSHTIKINSKNENIYYLKISKPNGAVEYLKAHL